MLSYMPVTENLSKPPYSSPYIILIDSCLVTFYPILTQSTIEIVSLNLVVKIYL